MAPPDKFGEGLISYDLFYGGLNVLATFCFVVTYLNCWAIGETLVNERINGGTFTGSENFQLPNKMMPVSSVFFFFKKMLLKIHTATLNQLVLRSGTVISAT